MTPAEWTAIFTGIYAGLTFLLLLVAIIAAVYAARQWRSAKENVEEQRKAQIEATRPYVTVTVEPGRASMQLFDLIVRNIGQRPAENVRIEIDPPPVRARELDGLQAESRAIIRNMKMLNEPMALLAPDQEIRAFYDNNLERKDRDDLPTAHSVKVIYSDTSGRAYEGHFTLDLLALKGPSWTEVGTVHTISKSLKAIEKSLVGSPLLKRGRLDVNATTEAYQERRIRKELEEYQNLKNHADLLRRRTPHDPDVAAWDQMVAAKEAAFQRRLEDEAMEPILSRVRRARSIGARFRRRLRGRAPNP